MINWAKTQKWEDCRQFLEKAFVICYQYKHASRISISSHALLWQSHHWFVTANTFYCGVYLWFKSTLITDNLPLESCTNIPQHNPDHHQRDDFQYRRYSTFHCFQPKAEQSSIDDILNLGDRLQVHVKLGRMVNTLASPALIDNLLSLCGYEHLERLPTWFHKVLLVCSEAKTTQCVQKDSHKACSNVCNLKCKIIQQKTLHTCCCKFTSNTLMKDFTSH